MNLPVSSLLGPIYFLSELLLSLFRRAKSGSAAGTDRGSMTVLWIVIGVSITVAYQIEFNWTQAGWPPRDWITAIGIVAMILGLALRWYSIIYLGRFFTVNVAIAADHKLIDGGPYRRVRHPSYTGALLAFLGLGICMQNWASLLLLMISCLAAFLYRIHVEESALIGAFGDRYRLYMQRTARLIPGVY
jgi:protein-S-isoprenylcysteine O-methyltransferase